MLTHERFVGYVSEWVPDIYLRLSAPLVNLSQLITLDRWCYQENVPVAFVFIIIISYVGYI